MTKENKIKLLFISGVLLPVMLFVFPIWSITLTAPQYPGGITMYIWINQITGDTDYTLQNVNILNHYIGMHFIKPDSIPELSYFSYVVIGMILLGIIFAFIKKKILKIGWIILFMILGALSIYDFYLWEYDYGHNLSSTAPIKIPGMVYQPPLIGSKILLNFKADSYPYYGALFLILSIIVCFVAYIWQNGTKNYE